MERQMLASCNIRWWKIAVHFDPAKGPASGWTKKKRQLMKTRHLGKTLVRLVAAVAAVGLLGLPAAADITADIAAGSLELYASDSTLYSTQDLSGTGSTVCTGNSGAVTDIDSTDGSFSASFNSHTSANIGGTVFAVYLTINLAGTISSTGVVSASGTAVAELYANSTCGMTGNHCTLTIANIALNGTSTITDHDVEVSDTVTVSGATGEHGIFEFNVVVTGACGGLSALDDGSVSFFNMVIVAGTEPINVSWEAVNSPAQTATCDFTLRRDGQQHDYEDGLARDTPALLAYGLPGVNHDVTITQCTKPGGGAFEIGVGSGCDLGGPLTAAAEFMPLTRVATPGPSLCHFRVKAI